VKTQHNLRAVASQFSLYGEYLEAAPYGTGHINDTYCVVFNQAGTPVRYILQRVNHNVFRNPAALMENVQRVTTHLAGKLAGRPGSSRRCLTLIPTRQGPAWYQDADGNTWRAYLFVEKARTYDMIESSEQAYQAAKAFGEFQGLLADLDPVSLSVTIPDFHHTPRRFERFHQVLAADVANRARDAGPEIEFVLHREAMAGVLLEQGLPERVTHNDTKLNNVMLDDASGEGLCVIDLDTVMPGLVLYDFGDMVRTSTCPAKEDDRDLSKIQMQFPLFEALVRGYLSSTTEFLTASERSYLAFSGKLITLEIGLRFLTDFLEGDVYFKVHRPGHNLDRCRTQFKLVESMEQQQDRMEKLVSQTRV
jgi:aminoglycoside phosphotransferase (APT) family kinase protein